MKRKILLIICIFLFPIIVNASSLIIDCGNDFVNTSTLTCKIKGKSNKKISAVSADVNSSNGLSFFAFNKDNDIWYGDGEEGKIDLVTSNDLTGDFDIGVLSLKASDLRDGGVGNISVVDIRFYDESGIEEKLQNVNKNIRIASTDNDLASLNVNNGLLNPAFNKDITTYSATINSSNVVIEAKAVNSNAKISGNVGNNNLSYGINNFKINVTSEAGVVKTYTINIIRPNDDNNIINNNINNLKNSTILKELKINDNLIELEENVFEYEVVFSYKIDKLEIIAVPEDNNSIVNINGNDNLQIGENRVQIIVTANDTTTKTYEINVIRKNKDSDLSSNNNISKLNIKNYDIKFNSDILDYNLKIKNEKKIDIDIILQDTTATYKIVGNENLKNGSKIKIIVTSEAGEDKIYNIIITTNKIKVKIIFIMIIILLIGINIFRILFSKRSSSKCLKK